MSGSDDLTQWILHLANGDETAFEATWEQHFEQVVRLSHWTLAALPWGAGDGDLELSTMRSVFRGAAPRLGDRYSLWNLVLRITARNAVAKARGQEPRKGDQGQVQGDASTAGLDVDRLRARIAETLGEESTSTFAAGVAETCHQLFDRLDDDDLRKIARFRMEGFSREEIAQALDCVVRTVERKLSRIREKWELDSGQYALSFRSPKAME